MWRPPEPRTAVATSGSADTARQFGSSGAAGYGAPARTTRQARPEIASDRRQTPSIPADSYPPSALL
ncbi:hypothetical protein, partial [Xenorhabdus bovienii]|uniref:hypothetical protein n=1 Tax=Xenorhabdus bovienii TaxID=40576 RepID=UPI003DA47CF3